MRLELESLKRSETGILNGDGYTCNYFARKASTKLGSVELCGTNFVQKGEL